MPSSCAANLPGDYPLPAAGRPGRLSAHIEGMTASITAQYPHGTLTREVEYTSYSELDAPVAALIQRSRQFPAVHLDKFAPVRTVGGDLYVQLFSVGTQPVRPEYGDRDVKTYFGWHKDRAEAEAALEDADGHYVIIDGYMWERTKEPFIFIEEYGLKVTVYPGPMPAKLSTRCFALGEGEAAGAAAAQLAEHFGREAPAVPEVRILIPEVFKNRTSAERYAQACATAAAAAQEAMELLEDVTEETLKNASRLLGSAYLRLREEKVRL